MLNIFEISFGDIVNGYRYWFYLGKCGEILWSRIEDIFLEDIVNDGILEENFYRF